MQDNLFLCSLIVLSYQPGDVPCAKTRPNECSRSHLAKQGTVLWKNLRKSKKEDEEDCPQGHYTDPTSVKQESSYPCDKDSRSHAKDKRRSVRLTSRLQQMKDPLHAAFILPSAQLVQPIPMRESSSIQRPSKA